MIKALVLDDGYHDKEVVMFYDNKTLLKTSLAYFINTHLCVPHYEDYQIKTVHYEDMEDNSLMNIFGYLTGMAFATRVENTVLMKCFNKIYNSDETVEGCDVY